MRQNIWAECAQTAALMNSLLFYDNSKKFYHRLENNQPKFEKDMRMFGEIGITLDHGLKTIKSKVDDKEIACMFVSYSLNHGKGVYKLYNMKTNRILISRDIMWLNQIYGQYKNKENQTQVTPIF